MKRLIISCIMAILGTTMVCAQNSLPLLKEGTKVIIPLNKKKHKRTGYIRKEYDISR